MKKKIEKTVVMFLAFILAFVDRFSYTKADYEVPVKGEDFVYDFYEITGTSLDTMKKVEAAFYSAKERGDTFPVSDWEPDFCLGADHYEKADLFVYDWVNVFSDDFFRNDGSYEKSKTYLHDGVSVLSIPATSLNDLHGYIGAEVNDRKLDEADADKLVFAPGSYRFPDGEFENSQLISPRNVQAVINTQLSDKLISDVRFVYSPDLEMNFAVVYTEDSKYIIPYYKADGMSGTYGKVLSTNGIERGNAYELTYFLNIFDDHFYFEEEQGITGNGGVKASMVSLNRAGNSDVSDELAGNTAGTYTKAAIILAVLLVAAIAILTVAEKKKKNG